MLNYDSRGKQASTHNLLINGGFDFWQRYSAGPILLVDDAYNAPDRWYGLTPTASSWAWNVMSGGPSSAKYLKMYQNSGNTNRGGFAQIVEHTNSASARGRAAIAQCQVKPTLNAGSGAMDLRIALLEWTGTADAVVSDVVGDWTSGVYTTNAFFINNASLSVVATGQVSASHNAWTSLSASGTVSASCNNLVVMIWNEDALASTSDVWHCAEAGLYHGSSGMPWSPRLVGDELALCQRYYQKSYDHNVSPGTVTGGGEVRYQAAGAGGESAPAIRYPVAMRIVNANYMYSAVTGAGGTGTDARRRNYSMSADEAMPSYNVQGVGGHSGGASHGADQIYGYHYTIDGEL